MKKLINRIKEFDKTKKRIFTVTLVAIGALLTTLIVTSYAMMTKSDGSDQKDLFDTGAMVVTFAEDTGSVININPAIPVSDEFGETTNPYKFTVKNTGDYNATYTIKLITNATTTIDLSNVKYSINGGSGKLLSDVNNNIIYEGVAYKGETSNLELRVWITENSTTTVTGLKYSGKIQLSGKAIKDGANPPKLASGMIPVVYDETKDVWVKADTTSKWYDYNNQMWANAVTVDNCKPGGDLNGDGVIDKTDSDLFQNEAWGGDVTTSDLAYEADINGDGKVNMDDLSIFAGIYGSYNNEYGYCTSPAKSRKTAKQRDYYLNAKAGTEIQMEDINAMWVWIPRFKYKISSNLGSSSAVTNPPMIDVIFENGTQATGVSESVYRTGIGTDGTNTNYYTHPAFRDIDNITYSTDTTKTSGSRGAWDEEITGLWVGKFETGTGNTTCNSSASEANCKDVLPIVKPDVKSLRYQNVSTQFLTSLKFSGGTMDTSTGEVIFSGNTIYGLGKEVNSHMMKNTEWGAVAYLSQSKYGKMGNNNYTETSKEVYINNSSGRYTGRSLGAPSPSTGTFTTNGTYSYNDKSCTSVTITTLGNTCTGGETENKGKGASTTGNIYGVYDMSGGALDSTMGNWNSFSGSSPTNNSGFSGTNGPTSGAISFPESKYYDLYKGSTSNSISMLKSIMGDATWETARWYSDTARFVYTSDPWAYRGGFYSASSYVGVFGSQDPSGTSASLASFRTTLIP